MINDWLDEHIEPIKAEKIKVFVEDECHPSGGDICGYGWGDCQQRLETKRQKLSRFSDLLWSDELSHRRNDSALLFSS